MKTNNGTKTWIHPMTRAGWGEGPFHVVGFHVATYQACPGAPVQVGASCDLCGTGIKYVYTVQAADGKRYRVGCDCVEKCNDTALSASARWEERREARETAAREAAARGQARAEREAAQAEENAEHLAMLILGARTVVDSPNADDFSRRIAEECLQALREGKAAGVTEGQFRILALGYFAASLPVPATPYVGQVGDRVKNVPAVLMFRHSFDTAYGTSTIAKYLVSEGPDAGKVLAWKSSGGFVGSPGDRVRITATVKEHGDYRGQVQTTITRAKVEDLGDRVAPEPSRF